jgi:glycosyltransferase involved in cell wall biosynthesis
MDEDAVVGVDGDAADRTPLDELSVAVAHWHVRGWGGAETLATALAAELGVDTVHTMGDPDPDAPNPYGDVRFESLLERLDGGPLRRLQSAMGRPAEYALWEDVDWRTVGDPDVLVTSGATTRAVVTPDDTLHVNYSHSPPRWFYDLYHDRKDSLSGILARPVVRALRVWDAALDPRVDHYLANSPVIARRLWKYYKRDATVLYPPIDLDDYGDSAGASAAIGNGDYYLHLGRLDAEKGIDAVVEAFLGTEHELVLAGGEGDSGDRVIERIATAPNAEYRGFVAEAEKRELLAGCRAVVFNGRNEDFGIVPVEANASGKPCLARDEGFPAHFVRDGENGYRHDGTAAGIRSVVERLERDGLDGDPREAVAPFAREAFGERLRAHVERWYAALEERGRPG